MGALHDFAANELARLGEDGEQQAYNAAILEILDAFSAQHFSGFVAALAAKTISRLVAFKPLTPLTGEDSEWSEPVCDGTRQNKRFPEVFRRKDGSAYWIAGKVFVEPNGTCYTSRDSVVDISFPFAVPDAPEMVHVDESGLPIESPEVQK